MTAAARWICVTSQQSIPLREGRRVDVGGHEIAIFNLGDRVMAIENRCPHRGGPLGDGIVSGNTIVCPLHSWKVCLSTGSVTKPVDTSACVSTFHARLDNGMIYIALPARPHRPTEQPEEQRPAATEEGTDAGMQLGF